MGQGMNWSFFWKFKNVTALLDIHAHLCHGDIVEDSELVESMDGGVEEAIRVSPPAVVMCS
jgi:hypothetical protein